MQAEIITIGDEILIGQVIDTNSAFISKELNNIGVSVYQITSVQDDKAHILKSLKEAEENGVAVVRSHRGGKGRISIGGEFPSADNLTPQKARILLMLALPNGKNSSELEEIFMTY